MEPGALRGAGSDRAHDARWEGGKSMAKLTVEALREYVNVDSDRDDVVLERRLNAALGALASHTRRLFTPRPALVAVAPPTDPATYEDTADPVAFTRPVRSARWVRVPDARDVTSISVDGVATTDFELHRNRDSDPDEWPYVWIELGSPPSTATRCEVTGRFGFVDFDDELEDAIYTVAAHRHFSADAGYADAIRSQAFGDRVWLKQFPTTVQTTLASLIVDPNLRLGFL